MDCDKSCPYQTPIFCNKNLLVGGKSFFYKSLVTEKFQEMNISLILNESNFILGNFPPNTSNTLQFLMLVARYYINMCRGTHKHLTFLEYKINVHSLFQSLREIAIQRNELQNFLDAWAPFKNLLNANL